MDKNHKPSPSSINLTAQNRNEAAYLNLLFYVTRYIIQMQIDKFESILTGYPVSLSQSELMEFQGYCSARNFSLEQLIDANITLYKVNPELSYSFLTYLDKHELGKPIYNDYQHQNSKITIYNNLTGLVLGQSNQIEQIQKDLGSKQEVDRFMAEAKRYLNSSQKVRMTVDKSIILNRAFLHYYAGQITKALNLVSRIYEEIQKTGQGKSVLVTATLMLAQIHYTKKNYQKALDLFKKCLQINKNLPVKGRIGMAYSFYYLGKYQMARACFQRILKLDPNCVEAYIGMAIIYEKEDMSQEYFKYISLAYDINKRHPLVLLHLAQHFLFRKELQKTNKFCQLGLSALEKYSKFPTVEDLCRNDYDEMKARFNNIIAQSHHINSNFIEAIKYYTLASGKGLIYNQIQFAQAYINPNSQNYIVAIKLLEDQYKLLQGKDNRLINDSFKLMAYLKSKVPPKAKEQKGADFYYNQALRFNRNDFDSKIQYAASILVETNKSRALKTLQEAEKIQIASGNQVKPELQNNIAVLYMENGEIQSCQLRLEKCLKAIEKLPQATQQQVVRKQSLKIVARFNYGICMQKQSKWHTAKENYQLVLALNKYHIDSAMRLAYVWYQLGSYKKTTQIFEQVDKLCEQNKKILRQDRIANAKAFIQHISGSSSQARDTLKILGKQRDIYSQIFDMCITYEGLVRKGVELNTLKEFLRPNRQFCYKICRDDHNAAFAYMLLAIILLADKKITKAQGIQFFNNLKQFTSEELPSLFFNMGLFLMNYDDYQNSSLIFNLYKDKVGVNCKTDQLLSLNYLLENNLAKAEVYSKRNILRDPCNLKYKLQYAYILQRRSNQYYQKSEFKKKEIEKRLAELKFCTKIHNYFSRLSLSESVKGIECLELKQRVKTIYMKVKNCGEERKFYIKSYNDSFEKVIKDLAEQETKRMQNQVLAVENQQDESKQLQLQRMLVEQQESEDQEQKQRKLLELKKQKVLEIARKRQAELDDNWNRFKQQDQYKMEQKKSKKRGPRKQAAKATSGRRRQRPKQKDSVQYQEEAQQLPQDQESASYKSQSQEEEPQLDEDSQRSQRHEKKHKKHKKQKHKKNKHKHRKEEKQEENEYVQSQKKSEKENAQDNNNQEDQELMKYMI